MASCAKQRAPLKCRLLPIAHRIGPIAFPLGVCNPHLPCHEEQRQLDQRLLGWCSMHAAGPPASWPAPQYPASHWDPGFWTYRFWISWLCHVVPSRVPWLFGLFWCGVSIPTSSTCRDLSTAQVWLTSEAGGLPRMVRVFVALSPLLFGGPFNIGKPLGCPFHLRKVGFLAEMLGLLGHTGQKEAM